ncbi:MAG: fumarylacetoacetate hydrolase family protein, partial [Bacteroidetes bacterium]|nr:fumarylacetoacetate hydrolase family protein [Bacteroidota bacterium]
MKLIRFGELNKEKPGVIIDGIKYDASAFGEDYNEAFFEKDGLSRLKKFIDSNKSSLPEIKDGVRLGSPVARPSKILCIGLNYADHARETGATPPAEPVLFMKSTTSLVGPDDNIVIPKNSKKT